MKKWIKRILKATLVLTLLVATTAAVAFLQWRRAIVDHLEDGSTVAATARGPVEYAMLGEGRPVLYLHGSPGGVDQVRRLLIAQYGEAGPPFRAIIPSRPGYLRTPLATGATPAEQADAFAALLDVVNVQRAVVLGASDGGPAAVEFALRHPGRCSGLILWSAVTQKITGDPSLLVRVYPLTDFIVWAAIQAQAVQGRTTSDPIEEAMLRALGKTIAPFGKRKVGKENDDVQVAALPAWPFEQIRLPTLIQHGIRDTAVPFSQAENAHARIPGSRLVRLDGGHLVGIRMHKEVAGEIRAFLAERDLPLESQRQW